MSHDSERVALYTALQEALPEGTLIRYETINEDDGVLSSEELWVLCSLKPYLAFQKSIGTTNPLKRSMGIFSVQIYDQDSNGYADIFRLSDTLETAFLHRRFDNNTLMIDKISQVQHPKKAREILSDPFAERFCRNKSSQKIALLPQNERIELWLLHQVILLLCGMGNIPIRQI